MSTARTRRTSPSDDCLRRFHKLVTTSHAELQELRRAQLVNPEGVAALEALNAFMVAEARLIGFIEGVMLDRPTVAHWFAAKAVQLLID